jgi:hypothetical protein
MRDVCLPFNLFSQIREPRNAREHLKAFPKTAKHFPSILVDFLGGWSGAIFREHAVTGFQRFYRLRQVWSMTGQFLKQALQRKTLRGRFRLQRRSLLIREFDLYGHRASPYAALDFRANGWCCHDFRVRRVFFRFLG